MTWSWLVGYSYWVAAAARCDDAKLPQPLVRDTHSSHPPTRWPATLVLLSYNEREALGQLLPMLPVHLFARVLAVDGGSTDGTIELFRNAGVETVLQQTHARGRGNAFRLAATLVDTPQIVFLSTDGNEDPRDLPRMLGHLNEGYDMVVASRFFRAGSDSDDSDDPLRLRKWATIAGSALAGIVWRSGVWDAINGYRGFQLASLKRLRLDATSHEVELQSTIRAAKLGLKVREFGTRELPRLGGARKPTAGTWTLLKSLGRLLFRELMSGRRNPR